MCGSYLKWKGPINFFFLFLLLQKEVKENVLFGLVWRSYQPNTYLLGISPQFKAFDTAFFFPPNNLHFKVEVNEWSGKFGQISPVTMVLTWLNCIFLENSRSWELSDLKSACSPALFNALPSSCSSTESVTLCNGRTKILEVDFPEMLHVFFSFFSRAYQKTPAAVKSQKICLVRIRTSLLLSQRKQTSE